MTVTFSQILRALRRRKGQASLEVLAAFVPWLLVTFLYLNLVFFFGSLMIVQAEVNRTALQASTAGCVSEGTIEDLENSTGLGAAQVSAYAVTTQQGAGQAAQSEPWGGRGNPGDPFNPGQPAKSKYIDPGSGLPVPGETRDIICSNDDSTLVEGGHVIYVVVEYDQQLILLGDQHIVRSATIISQQREGLI